MHEQLELRLQEIDWPYETLVRVEITQGGASVWLDVDLPEIEDLPTETVRVSANGRRLLRKSKSSTAVRKEYAPHVHGICFRLIGESFAALPRPEKVVVSGYSQRIDASTGRERDDYLLSVRAGRDALAEIDFMALEGIDPIAALERLDLKRNMTKTGIFRPIDPFDCSVESD